MGHVDKVVYSFCRHELRGLKKPMRRKREILKAMALPLIERVKIQGLSLPGEKIDRVNRTFLEPRFGGKKVMDSTQVYEASFARCHR